MTDLIIDQNTDREAWLEARRAGVTATEIAALAKGYGSDRRRILTEKLTGERQDLSGNRYIEWGNKREPLIQEWISDHFDIDPANGLYRHAADPRWMATPDCLSSDSTLTAEIKTSGHDLTPGKTDDNGSLIRIDPDSYFATTGYYDQMQWQMFVVDAVECLFVWEQHDGNWPVPTPLDVEHVWIKRDDVRIAELITIAERFVQEVESYNSDDIDAADVSKGLPDEEAELALIVLEARAAEAEAKARKEAAWKRLQDMAADRDDFVATGLGARVSWTTTVKDVRRFDLDLARSKAPKAVEAWETLQARYTVTEEKVTRTLNVGTDK